MEARAILARAGAAELALSEFGTLKRGTLACSQPNDRRLLASAHLVAFQRAFPALDTAPSSERRSDFNAPIYALPSAFRTSPPPRAPGLSLTGFRLVSRTTPWGFPCFRDVLRDRAVWRRKRPRIDSSSLSLGQCRKERGDQHSPQSDGGTSDRDGRHRRASQNSGQPLSRPTGCVDE